MLMPQGVVKSPRVHADAVKKLLDGQVISTCKPTAYLLYLVLQCLHGSIDLNRKVV